MSKSEISLSIPESNESAFFFNHKNDTKNSDFSKSSSSCWPLISRSTLLTIFKNTLLAAAVPFIFLYIVVPVVFNVFPHFTQHIFFLNFGKYISLFTVEK